MSILVDTKAIVSSIFEASTLRMIPRSHRQTLFISDISDNIAAHSFLVTYIGYILAHLVEGAHPERVATMCVFHDHPETRTGDQNWVHKRYVSSNETEIREAQLTPLAVYAPKLIELMREYDERLTTDAKVGKDADVLAQCILLCEHRQAGNLEAARWLETIESKKKRLHTDEARQLLEEIVTQRPSSWWDNIWSATRK